MGIINRIGYAVFTVILAVLVLGCQKSAGSNPGQQQTVPSFASFRDIPGITEDEIRAIENLQKQVDHLVYGTPLGTETFITEGGKIDGYTALLCGWLSTLFGIRFEPEILEWGDIHTKLKTGGIDFTNLTVTEERLKTYFMTDPVAEHLLKIMRIADSAPLDRIALTRLPRYVFLENSVTMEMVVGALQAETYEVILARNYDNVYQLMKSGDADAFIENSVVEAVFEPYGDVVIEDFLPLIFNSVSMAAENPALAPIISVVTKALKNGGIQHVNALYKQGYENYIKNQFLKSLNAEERAYMQNPPVVPVLAENWFYPLNYYNRYEKKWEGIAFDVLDEVTNLTGLVFKVANTPDAPWAEMFQMMNEGKVFMSLDLIYTPERSSRYLWSKYVYLSENYALVSKYDLPNISISDIQYAKIGLIKSTGYAEMFQKWFPGAVNATVYDTQDDAFLALDRDEVDLVMAGTNVLSSLTNYYELSNYKANYVFNSTIDYVLVFNKDQSVLCSVIDKALAHIDLDIISKQWESKTFDYQSKLMRAQRPWLFGAIFLIFGVLVLILVFYQKNILIRKQFESIWNNVETGTVIIDAETRKIIDTNPVVVRMFGDAKEKIIGQHCSKLFCVNDGCPMMDNTQQIMSEDEREFKNSSGETIPIAKNIAKIRYNGRPALLESFTDISYIKKAEEAKSASEAKSRFIALMSHEMRTPMNVIVGITDLMLEDNTVPEIKNNLKKINTAANTLLGLINDVLDISKIEAGKLELTPVQYDVASLLNDIININIMRIGDKPITFRLDIDDKLPCTLYGDDLRVRQIASNLLSNAFKYTKSGTVTLGVRCERGDGEDVWMFVYVSDTGMGIRKNDLSKLFSDYNQVDTRANRQVEGTGLGLSITKKLVELMNGEISVKSEYGAGTTFNLRIRQSFVADKSIGAETAKNLCSFSFTDNREQECEKLERSDLSNAAVLVVDDIDINVEVVSAMLSRYNMRVDCAFNGQDAIEKVKLGEPVYNAIFMDHMMPGMDGIEATAKIRAIETEYAKKVPIIALTANAIAGNKQMFLENGFQAFLPKPVNIIDLDSVVKEWIMD
jgi:PAS domain S-box-containing protein